MAKDSLSLPGNMEKTCQRCGKESGGCLNDLQVERSDKLVNFLSSAEWEFLCKGCLDHFENTLATMASDQLPDPSGFIEGLHFYKENGNWVFTEYYHLLRGHCCKSGCRHCAYGFSK